MAVGYGNPHLKRIVLLRSNRLRIEMTRSEEDATNSQPSRSHAGCFGPVPPPIQLAARARRDRANCAPCCAVHRRVPTGWLPVKRPSALRTNWPCNISVAQMRFSRRHSTAIGVVVRRIYKGCYSTGSSMADTRFCALAKSRLQQMFPLHCARLRAATCKVPRSWSVPLGGYGYG